MSEHWDTFSYDVTPPMVPGHTVSQYPSRDFTAEAAVKRFKPHAALTDEEALRMINEALSTVDGYHGDGPSEALLSTLVDAKYLFHPVHPRVSSTSKYRSLSHAVFVRGTLGSNYWYNYEGLVHQNVYWHFARSKNPAIVSQNKKQRSAHASGEQSNRCSSPVESSVCDVHLFHTH